MMGHTHAIIGGLVGAWAAAQVDPGAALAGGAVGVIAALLPDIDHPRSEIRRKTGLLGNVFFFWLPHRGLTHTLVALFAVGALAHAALPMALALAVTSAYASHLLADACTPAGVPLLWPAWSDRVRTPITVKTGGIIEAMIGAALLVVAGGLLVMRM